MQFNTQDMEKLLFKYIDEIKAVISNELWENILLNSTKNEMFILLLLYRSHQVNMTQISDYINVPLNTATGIVARMEKKRWIRRERSMEDKRVVTIVLDDQGKEQMQKILEELIYYGTKVMKDLTTAEMELLATMFDKVVHILNDAENHRQHSLQKSVIKKIEIQ